VKPYRTVVVGTDGSARANEAVRQAAQLAAASAARLVVVTAYTPQASATRVAEEVPEEIRWRITDSAHAEETAGEASRLARAEGVADVRVRSEAGDPGQALIEVAEDTGADLIVVGSKGLTGATRFLLGSVPNKISNHAPCDVLIVDTAAAG
jgi:nucleotide-binding universal stress UspA family protein